MTFHGHDFELVVGGAHAWAAHGRMLDSSQVRWALNGAHFAGLGQKCCAPWESQQLTEMSEYYGAIKSCISHGVIFTNQSAFSCLLRDRVCDDKIIRPVIEVHNDLTDSRVLMGGFHQPLNENHAHESSSMSNMWPKSSRLSPWPSVYFPHIKLISWGGGEPGSRLILYTLWFLW